MKKDLLIYLANVVAAICVIAIIINTAPGYASQIGTISSGVAAVFSPQINMEKITEETTAKKEKSDNTNNTAAISASRSTDGIKGKDSDLYSDITKIPDDIEKLMSDAEKTIKDEKVKGKTSEEDYFGGGTLISHDRVEIQSKIPSSFYEPNIEELLKQKADLSIQDISKPTILVYHSHTTESYTLIDAGYYTESLDLRSKDNAKNMVRVGDELVKYLELQGFNVIHDTDIHDENYSGAYDSSRKNIEKYLEEYPSIEITIDVHRDDITYDNNTKVKPTATINGKKAARMMIIAGAEYGSIKNYPNWEYNLRFDLAVQNKVEEMYSGLMRPILFAERKYNMFETKNSFLLEVGTDGNTLDEACYSARLFATALGELLKDEYVEK
ncbi:MAG: stage II sporulation protein P [Eubacterium sp.]|nr:stage II sporulation protein P [Eubacterium sp.]